MTHDIEICNEDDPSDQLGPLMDSLIESPDETTEVWGDPATWPDEYDSIRVCLGPAIHPQETIDPFDPLPVDEVDEIPF